MQKVQMSDGSTQELFVTTTTLARLFKSTLATLLRSPNVRTSDLDPGTVGSALRSPTRPARDEVASLQSEGGSNRFLGISSADGSRYSVGVLNAAPGVDGLRWVEWRQFIPETLSADLTDAEFVIQHAGRTTRVNPDRYERSLEEIAAPYSLYSYLTRLPISVRLDVTKASVAELIIRLAHAVAKIHAAGFIHGDLKPQNALVSSGTVVPIDSFQLAAGDIAPGWTKDWSAPEQVLSRPVTFASDVYPFGVMISELLGGTLIGEVRKFKYAYRDGRQEEFGVFSDPSIRLVREHETKQYAGWIDLACRCLRFDPAKRPQTMQALIDELGILVKSEPIQGTVQFVLENNLAIARFPGGAVGLARLLTEPSDLVSTGA
jgi:hypothetical protein